MAKRICVVGTGRWGRNHARTLHELGLLGGIVDSSPETLEQMAAQYPGVKTFANVRDALDESFDGFTVATPAHTHLAVGEMILSRGVPTLIEKPMALRANDARRLKALAEANGANLMVGHVLLFHPAIRKMKELISAGKIGRLEYLYSNRLNLGTVRTEENILWSFAPHDISIFQHLTESYPDEVVSRGGAFLQPRIHDTTMTLLRYPGNIVGHVFVSWLHPFKEHRLIIIGAKGMLSFEDSSEEKRILFYEKGIDWIQGEPIARDGPTEAIIYDSGMPLTEELRYFADHCGGAPIEIADVTNAIEVLDILERATEQLLGESERAPAPNADDRNYFVHPTSCIDDDVQIGDGTKIWHYSHVQSGARIGSNCSLGQNVNVGANTRVGDHVKIQNNVSVYEGVELEDYVFCGPSMTFTNVLNPRSKYPQRGSEFYKRTLVREGSTIGANATILCGTTIGRHAFIGAGAVVTRDVPDYALMLGVPATRAGWACECGERLESETETPKCSACARAYRLAGPDALVPA